MVDDDFIFVEGYKHIRYKPVLYTEEEILNRTKEHFELVDKRRSVRYFSDKQFSFEIIENIIKSASTAPSGANKQPWTFCVVKNPEIKRKIIINNKKYTK